MTEEILFSSLLRDTSQSVIPRKINTDRLRTLFYNSKNSMLQFHKGYKKYSNQKYSSLLTENYVCELTSFCQVRFESNLSENKYHIKNIGMYFIFRRCTKYNTILTRLGYSRRESKITFK